MIETITAWFLSLGAAYGVNPFIFGAIYIGAIPFFSLSVAWLVRNYRHNKSIVLPVICAGMCFVSAYVYLLIAGENVPGWVYVVIVLLLLYGGYSTFKSIRRKVHNVETTSS